MSWRDWVAVYLTLPSPFQKSSYQPRGMDFAHPFEAHPLEQARALSLLQFNNLFIELDAQRRAQVNDEHARAEARSNALTLGLTGLNAPAHTRVIIEPLRDRLRPPYELDISRDFDSLISFTDELPNLHVKVRMHTQAGQPPQLVHPHKVPNICIAQIGARHSVRLFFPALMQAAEGRTDLTDDQLAAVYEHGLYPAIRHLSPELATNWSPSYAAAKLRARNLNGTYQAGTHPFPGDCARRLGSTVKQYLQDTFPWAIGCKWMVQIQGVKEAHTHAPNDDLESYLALEDLLDGLISHLILQGQSWIDVGLQVSLENCVLQWRTDSHHLLLKEFGNLTEHAATQLCRLPSRSYHRDYVAGLVDLSGFRITLDRNQPETRVAYVQAYTTDKSLIAHLEAGRHGLFMRGRDALQGDEDNHIPNYCKRMMVIYAAGVNHTTAARVEARIPARAAADSMPGFPERLLERTLCQYSAVDWWQWRQIRMHCIGETLALQNSAHPSLKYMREALNLTGALVWLANGLNSRPEDDQYGRDIMITSCMTAENQDRGIFLIQPPAQGGPGDLPVVRQGAIFLRRILFPPHSGVPRFSYGKELNNATWIHLFNQTPDELRLQALPPPFVPRRELQAAGRVPTQKRMSRPHRVQINVPLPELANLHFPLLPIPQDIAQDLPYEEQVEYLGDIAQDLPTELTRLWRQFLTDLIQKCGNLRGARADASHCRLSMLERQNVTQEVLLNVELSAVFNRVQYRRANPREWANAFGHYFSPLDVRIPIQPQNFPSMLYWRRWAELKSLVPEAVGQMRRQLRVLFDQLLWVPQPASDRVWLYQREDRFDIFPRDCTSNAPQILMHPHSAQPEWNRQPGIGEDANAEDEVPQRRVGAPQPMPYAHLRQEEEGSSD